MQFNNKFSMKDLFMNKELKHLFPQFTKREELKNVYSFSWVDKKITNYLKAALNGRMRNGDIVVNGKYKEKFNEVKSLKEVLEGLFNNMPSITKNIRKNTKLFTPFQSIDQLKQISSLRKKLQIMQIIFDNINYNPDFQSENRITQSKDKVYLRKQQHWLKSVGYYQKRS